MATNTHIPREAMMANRPELDVAVVGAGPSGLILARRLAATGASFEVFERNDDVGGIWDIDAPGSPMYESAHFISSRTLSGFPDFPMPDDYPDYPDHRRVLAYIRAYADRLDGEEVVFSDGTRERIDLVIAATGYQQTCPFLDDGVLPARGGRPDLYLGIFPRNHPNMAVLGFIEVAAAAYPTFDRMAELIVADATATPGSQVARHFSHLKADHHPDVRGGRRYIDSPRHANYVEFDAYLKILGKVRTRLGLDSAAGPHRLEDSQP